MADWAIVIGVNEYPAEPKYSLKGAVRDAVEMTKWLLAPDGGGVPRRNLSLLLSPSDPVPAELGSYVEATRGNIILELNRLLNKSGGRGDRFYFYFSGHGLHNRVDFGYQEVLIPKDFQIWDPTISIDLGSIRRRLQATQFADQFFFIDACRNIPWEGVFRTGSWPWDVDPDPTLPAVQQFVFYATSPGVRAREIQMAGDEEVSNERGAFTAALLDGLRGRGSAKAWDPAGGEYVVRVERMFRYIRTRMMAARIQVGDEVRHLFQIPTLTGEQGGHDPPELARFPKEDVPREPLNVFLEPSAVVPVAKVVVQREEFEVESRTNIPGLPVTFRLPPREYTVSATAPDYESVEKRWPAEVYEPRELSVRFVGALRAPSGDVDEGVPEVIIEDEEGTAVDDMVGRGAYKGIATQPSSSERPKLVVESADQLAPLEVADSTGSIVKTGQGRLEATDLRPGYYHVSVRTPENQVTEKLVELVPGKAEAVHLHAPEAPQTRLVQEVVEDANLQARDDNTLEVSEPSEIGPVASPRLSTFLALAGSVANHDEESLSADPLKNLNPKGFSSIVGATATSGLYLVFGFDSHGPEEAHEHLSGTRLRVWPQADPVPESFEEPLPFSNVTGLAEYARSTDTGPHWCSIELPGQNPLIFVLTMLPQRFSMLVLDREPDGTVQAFQYLPRIEPDTHVEPEALRQSELIQRFYLGHRFGRAYDLLDSPVPMGDVDPLAECMTGYLLLRLGRTERLGAVADKIIRSYPGLSDGCVLRAEYEASIRNDDAAAAAFRSALDQGLPIFGYGLIRLHGAIHKYGIEHPHTTLLDKVYQYRATSLLWSAWIPEKKIKPGARLAS